MLLSFSISPRVPATKRAPAIVKLEFDPTKIVIDKDQLVCMSSESENEYKCSFDLNTSQIIIEYYDVQNIQPVGET